MNLNDTKIWMRLSVGFGLVMLLMVALIVVALTHLARIGDINDRIIDEEWVKADVAQTINDMTRANAQQTVELFITIGQDKVSTMYKKSDANKKTIDGTPETLDKLVYGPDGKALLKKIKESRAVYVASFSKVVQLLAEQKRDDATSMMRDETLPALDSLQTNIMAMVDLQKTLVDARGAEAKKTIESARDLMKVLGLAAVLIGVGFAYCIACSITQPFRETALVAHTIASGDLTSSIRVRTRGETGQLLQSLKDMNESLKNIVGEMHTGTNTIATASSQIVSGNLDLSSRTEEQANSLEETVASMQELTSTVKRNADNAQQANRLAVSASEVASKGGAVILQVVDTMDSINELANKIVDIIGVINGIAFPTNILALNAAVDAARAGEQGRNFVVVAVEVRNLAQRSANAAKEIKTLIDDSVDKVDAGSQLVAQASATMGEITAASQAQSPGIEQVNQAMNQMDQVTQQNAALVEGAAAAQSLEEQAVKLDEVVSVFKISWHTAIGAADRDSVKPSGLAGLKGRTRRLLAFVKAGVTRAIVAGRNADAAADTAGAEWLAL